VGAGASLAPTATTLRRTGTVTATTGPPTTAGAEKNVTTEARFPQRLSIRWTPPSRRTGAGWKGGWRNNATAMDDNGDDSGVVEERCRTGGGGDAATADIVTQGADSTRYAREQGGDTRGVDGIRQVYTGPAIPPGGEGGEEEGEEDPIDGGCGGSDDPCRPPNGIWEQRRRRQLRRR